MQSAATLRGLLVRQLTEPVLFHTALLTVSRSLRAAAAARNPERPSETGVGVSGAGMSFVELGAPVAVLGPLVVKHLQAAARAEPRTEPAAPHAAPVAPIVPTLASFAAVRAFLRDYQGAT